MTGTELLAPRLQQAAKRYALILKRNNINYTYNEKIFFNLFDFFIINLFIWTI